MIDSIWRSLRWSLRAVGRRPGSAAIAIVIIALGVGVNAAIFTVINGLLLRPPGGVRSPDRLVRLGTYLADNSRAASSLAYADYLYYRDHAVSLAGLAGYDTFASSVALNGAHGSDQADAAFVTGSFFTVLGVRPAAGRLIVEADDGSESAATAVVMSEAYWERRYGRDPSIVGSELTVNGHPFSVVGIVSRQFRALAQDDATVDLWLPVWSRPRVIGRTTRDFERIPGEMHAFLSAVGRMAPGVTEAGARANVQTLTGQIAREFGYDLHTYVTRHVSLRPDSRAAVVSLARLLAGVAAIVLLIACANLANLQLVRATARRKEMGLRLALGASRGALVRQLVGESVTLAIIGGAAGLAAAVWTSELLVRFLPLRVDPSDALRLDWHVLGFAMALSVLTGLGVGIAPALRSTQLDITPTLKAGHGAIEGRSRLRGLLVALQVALSFVLVFGAGLFVRTLAEVRSVPLGFDPRPVLTGAINLRPYGYSPARGAAFYDQLLVRARAIPGVRSAALGVIAPLTGLRRTGDLLVQGAPQTPGAAPAQIDMNVVTPDYFATVGMSIRRGRGFANADDAAAPPVAIINEALARRFWPGGDALGGRIRRSRDSVWTEIVGIVADAKYMAVGEAPVPYLFQPFAQRFDQRMRVFVRTAGDPSSLAPSLRSAVQSIDPNVPILALRPLSSVYDDSIRQFTTNATLVSILGGLALALAALGLYGVMSFVVGQRVREIGVRMALGARAGNVVRRVTADALALVALGLLIGIPVALLAARAVGHLLYGVPVWDAASMLVAAGALLLSALAASFGPARRASRVDPVVALRSE